MATRSIWCIIIARSIRTVAFMLTVLPSQRPGCYSRRFPPVPGTWQEFLVIGFGRLRSSGGCNDLIISGAALHKLRIWLGPTTRVSVRFTTGNSGSPTDIMTCLCISASSGSRP